MVSCTVMTYNWRHNVTVLLVVERSDKMPEFVAPRPSNVTVSHRGTATFHCHVRSDSQPHLQVCHAPQTLVCTFIDQYCCKCFLGRRMGPSSTLVYQGRKGAFPYPCGEFTNVYIKQGLPSWKGEYWLKRLRRKGTSQMGATR